MDKIDNKNVLNVKIDLATGNYLATKEVGNKLQQVQIPINGVDRTLYYKENYKGSIVRRRQKEIIEEYNFPKSLIEYVDTTLYKMLEDFDAYYNTNYKTTYLNIISMKIKRNVGESKSDYDLRCREVRAQALKEAGIYISYDVGLVGGSKGVKILDRIKGWRMAIQQAKYIGVDYSFQFKYNHEEDDDLFSYEMDDDIDFNKSNISKDNFDETYENLECLIGND